ncbi:asuR2 protein [Streptomyces laurentii]|uniref:AsuR2 protein n=1 Tax=Streptomyces laurentii TaxID=39478 RepID=A0A160NSE7_STRLU|nr:asuR2 protein [Streptomyces laurentii]
MANSSSTRGTSLDPRARRTRALLRAAVLDLSTEKDLDSITMSDIAQRAEVNRATVYLHYKDREDLLLDATESTMEGVVEAARACRLSVDTHALPDATPTHLISLFAQVDQHRAVYRQMLGEDGSARCATRLEHLLAQAWFEQLTAEPPGSPHETALQVRAHFLSGAVLAVIGRWTRGDFDGEGEDGGGGGGGNGNGNGMSVAEVADLTWALIRGQK